MKRWLYAHRIVKGSPPRLEAVLRARIGALVRRATGSEESDVAADGSFLVAIPAEAAGLPVTKAVRVTTGVATRSGDRVRIPVVWHAEWGRAAFPSFEGAVEFEPHSRSTAQLSLVGAYHPPLGPAGAAIDAMVMRSVAERTAERLVEGLAQALASEADEDARAAARAHGATGLTVRDVMTPDPLVLEESLPLRTAALLLFHYGVGGAPVVGSDGALVGVLSEGDLIEKEALPRHGFGRAAAESERRRVATTVGEACTRPARVTAADAPLRAAAREMASNRIARLVVLDESRIAGIVTRHDVLRALIRSDAEIAAAVDVILDELDEPGLAAQVEWGAVRLEGSVRLRSRVSSIIRLVEEIDGVISVDDTDLSWASDDIAPPSVYVHPM